MGGRTVIMQFTRLNYTHSLSALFIAILDGSTQEHLNTHTHARVPTRPREHKKSGERKGRCRSSDLPILQ